MEIHLKKNEAAYLTFPMVTTANPETFDTGETVTDTAYYKDGAGSWTSLAITDTVTEIATTGMYSIDLTASEMNHDLIAIKFTSTNAADTMLMVRTYAVDVDDLVRSTTPANSLDVTATGAAGIDWGNVENQSTSVDLSATATNLVDTCTTNTDMRGTDSALLASSAPTNFSDLAITVTTGQVTVGTNNDKTGYSISGTKTTLDALNDIAATDVVSAGAITTLAGAVVNVDTVDTCTTNTDMRGTDNALLAASAPTNFSDLAITVTTGKVTVGTNDDKTGYSISGTKTTLDALNDIAATSIVSAGAITTLAGAVVNVDTVDTCTTNSDMRGTDSAALASVCTEARLAELDAANLPTDIATVDTVVDGIQTDLSNATDGLGAIKGAVDGLNDLSAAQVNAEVVDALITDTYAEPGQGAPAATASLKDKIGYLYKAWRNKTEQTSTTLSLYDDAGTTVDQKATVADNGTTASRSEIVTGP